MTRHKGMPQADHERLGHRFSGLAEVVKIDSAHVDAFLCLRVTNILLGIGHKQLMGVRYPSDVHIATWVENIGCLSAVWERSCHLVGTAQHGDIAVPLRRKRLNAGDERTIGGEGLLNVGALGVKRWRDL